MPKLLIDLHRRDCRYIIEPGNQDRGALYCAEPVAATGVSMCEEHMLRCYQKASSKYQRMPIGLPVDNVAPEKPLEPRITNVLREWK
jgi:hypothetical protein